MMMTEDKKSSLRNRTETVINGASDYNNKEPMDTTFLIFCQCTIFSLCAASSIAPEENLAADDVLAVRNCVGNDMKIGLQRDKKPGAVRHPLTGHTVATLNSRWLFQLPQNVARRSA